MFFKENSILQWITQTWGEVCCWWSNSGSISGCGWDCGGGNFISKQDLDLLRNVWKGWCVLGTEDRKSNWSEGEAPDSESWHVAAINTPRKVIIKIHSSLFIVLSCLMLYYYMNRNILPHTVLMCIYIQWQFSSNAASTWFG